MAQPIARLPAAKTKSALITRSHPAASPPTCLICAPHAYCTLYCPSCSKDSKHFDPLLCTTQSQKIIFPPCAAQATGGTTQATVIHANHIVRGTTRRGAAADPVCFVVMHRVHMDAQCNTLNQPLVLRPIIASVTLLQTITQLPSPGHGPSQRVLAPPLPAARILLLCRCRCCSVLRPASAHAACRR